MDNIQSQLQRTGDFLTLSRKFEWALPQSFSFNVLHALSNTECKVTVIDTGIILFEPLTQQSTKDIVLSSGIHGNETAPIEICSELISQLILGKLPLAERVLFLFGNVASMNIAKRFVEENMNRLFSGAHSKGNSARDELNKECERAKLLEHSVKTFFEEYPQTTNRERLHYDLHTAIRGAKFDKFAVYPHMNGKPRKKSQLQFLKACGVNTILLSNSPTTTFSYFSADQFDADSFTVELGKVKPFGENDMSQFSQVRDTLTKLISGESIEVGEYCESDYNIFAIFQTINRTQEAFSLNFSDETENFTDFPVGYVLAKDGENEIKVKQKGEAIVFPNANVAIGQRAILTVVPAPLD